MIRGRLIVVSLVLLVLTLASTPFWLAIDRSSAQVARTDGDRQASTIVVPDDTVTIRVLMGLRDRQPTRWTGQISLSEGKILASNVWRTGIGDQAGTDGQFRLQTRSVSVGKGRRAITENGLLLTVQAPDSAQLKVSVDQGDFQVPLRDLMRGKRIPRLQGQAAVDQIAGSVEVAASEREEDFPAAAAGQDGTAYVAYVAHSHIGAANLNPVSRPLDDFTSFQPTSGGDQLMLASLTGTTWSAGIAVTEPGLDLWRPSVVVDDAGTPWVIWSPNVEGNWDLYARRCSDGRRQEQPVIRLTEDVGADINVATTRDAQGRIWLAWQAWRDGDFDVHVATLDGDQFRIVTALSEGDSNAWSPAIAADRQGNVYVAWDSYATGNYDVQMAIFKADQDATQAAIQTIAGSPQYEVRPSLACDGQGRVWIAWEERSVNWGKDDWGAVHAGPGSALYREGSRVRVACWSDGRLRYPAGDIVANFAPDRMKSMNGFPRLGITAGGRVWLALRHREQRRNPAGTFWQTYLTTYEEDQWSPPTLLMYSDNLLDNRPALVDRGNRLLVVHSGDGRNRFSQQAFLNNHLFVSYVARDGTVQEAQLSDTAPSTAEPAPSAVVHPRESMDIARTREFRLELGDETYQLMRGEFHRHTEISGDGGGDGALEDMWRYALDAARMDWIGNGDHDNGGGREYTWWITQKTTDIFHHAPNFVPMFTYERSVTFPDGHRNVMFAQRGIRTLPRLRPQAGETKANNVSVQDTPMLYRYLKKFNGICAVHTSATDMGTDWRDNDPLVEPIVEIYQGDRQNYEHLGAPRSPTPDNSIGGYQPDGFIWNALEKGYRLGFQASSDHISTHISYAIAVVQQPTREGILDAFQQRHCYGATDNMILVVTSGDHLMGDEFVTDKPPTLTITAHGTAPIAKLAIIKDLKYAYTTGLNQQQVQVEWTDHDARAETTSFYYVRIEQEDGQIAWASPLWITYRP